jgi:hypothetical protein
MLPSTIVSMKHVFMKKIICISCVKSKRNRRSKAAELYTSTLFTKALHYAESLKPDRILILSAEYGVLELDDEVDPYEKTLNTMRVTERKQWAQRVLTQLRTKANLQVDEFIFLASEKYREYLIPHIKRYTVPMYGLPIGKQLGWLTEHRG